MAPRRIFVPHVHEDDEHVDKLRQFLNRSGREVDVSAIDSSSPNNTNNPDYIMSTHIRPKVEWCEAIVVLISPATQDSDWVDKEIELAKRLDKRIVGVWIPGSEGCPIPQGLPGLRERHRLLERRLDPRGHRRGDQQRHRRQRHPDRTQKHRAPQLLAAGEAVFLRRRRDYGFAPNPFHGICTLATCKPVIRRVARRATGSSVPDQPSTNERANSSLRCTSAKP